MFDLYVSPLLTFRECANKQERKEKLNVLFLTCEWRIMKKHVTEELLFVFSSLSFKTWDKQWLLPFILSFPVSSSFLS